MGRDVNRLLPALVVVFVVASGCSGDSSTVATDAGTSTTELTGASTPAVLDTDFGSGSEWIDEPLSILEELVGASTCEDFMRMLVGVQNERFRLKVDVTAADDEANNYTHWDFDDYDVFAELQTDVGCGDGEFFTVLDNASHARCARWMTEGHSPDEDPLMLNTAQC
jgi:hypothetical protein